MLSKEARRRVSGSEQMDGQGPGVEVDGVPACLNDYKNDAGSLRK